MTGHSFDTNIIIDALTGRPEARVAIEQADGRTAISRMVWIEVLSQGSAAEVAAAERFMSAFDIDEIDAEIAARAAALRRENGRLTSPDAVVLASALVRGRELVTRNTKDFPATMPGIHVPYTT